MTQIVNVLLHVTTGTALVREKDFRDEEYNELLITGASDLLYYEFAPEPVEGFDRSCSGGMITNAEREPVRRPETARKLRYAYRHPVIELGNGAFLPEELLFYYRTLELPRRRGRGRKRRTFRDN